MLVERYGAHEEDEEAVVAGDGSLDGFPALVVVTGDSNCPYEEGLAAAAAVLVVSVVVVDAEMYCIAVAAAVQAEGQGEEHNADGEEEHRVLDLAEGSYMMVGEQVVEMVVVVVVAAGYSSSDVGARRIHDDSGLFYLVQNTVCRSPR